MAVIFRWRGTGRRRVDPGAGAFIPVIQQQRFLPCPATPDKANNSIWKLKRRIKLAQKLLIPIVYSTKHYYEIENDERQSLKEEKIFIDEKRKEEPQPWLESISGSS